MKELGRHHRGKTAYYAGMAAEHLIAPNRDHGGFACLARHGDIHGVRHGLAFNRLMKQRKRKARLHLHNDRLAVIRRMKRHRDQVCCADFAFDLIAPRLETGFQRRVKVCFL